MATFYLINKTKETIVAVVEIASDNVSVEEEVQKKLASTKCLIFSSDHYIIAEVIGSIAIGVEFAPQPEAC